MRMMLLVLWLSKLKIVITSYSIHYTKLYDKSSLLKIIAGLDKSFQGELVFSPGYSVGYLEQEPHLDPAKTVKQVVEEGVQEVV